MVQSGEVSGETASERERGPVVVVVVYTVSKMRMAWGHVAGEGGRSGAGRVRDEE